MDYYDQHVHTDFSFDSDEKMAAYLKLAGDNFVSTEHLDFKDADDKDGDDLFDYDAYSREIHRLEEDTGKHIFKGVEIGYFVGREKDIKSYLKKHDFDIKLLSFHRGPDYDFDDSMVSQMDPLKVADQYYRLMWKGINAFHDADVLAHFDYGVRQLNLTSGMFETKAGVLLANILKLAVRYNMAFELNTTSMYKYHNIGLYDYALEIYKQLGGKRFTIGSDAHDTTQYMRNYENAVDMLKAHDIHHVNVYRKNAMIIVPLDDVDEGIKY